MIRKLICSNCGETFQFERSGTGPLPSFCDKCQTKRPVASIVINCKECGKEFSFHTSVGKPPKFCSPRCRKINLKNYQRQYYHERHSEEPVITFTEHVNRIAQQPCVRCNNTTAIHPNQIIPGYEEIGNIIPLCEKCGFSYYEQKWNISDIEDKLKKEYNEQYWWLQIQKCDSST